MEYGWWSLLPPVLAISLAFITRNIILSLFIGVFSGTLIIHEGVLYSSLRECMVILWNNSELAHFSSWENFQSSWHLFIVLFCFMLGAVMKLVDRAGGAQAYGNWALRHIKTRTQASLSTMFLGILIFFDDYFSCLTVGAVMRSVTDKFHISRAKLAYIIDATTASVCILTPISSWVIYVVSQFRASGIEHDAFSVFLYTIPFNFYAWLSLAMVFLVCIFDVNLGSMKMYEQKAREKEVTSEEIDSNSSIWDLLLPIFVLVVSIVGGMLYTGGYHLLGGDYSLIKALQNMSAGKAMFWGGALSLGFSILYFLWRKTFDFKEIMRIVLHSFGAMLPVICILILSWSIGTIISEKLKTGTFIVQLLHGSTLQYILPVLVFALSCFTAFSTGSSWGTFAIMIPIAIPMATPLDSHFLTITLAAVLAGAIYGDHCSPISDTTILSSVGAGCKHIDHVTTQAPYCTVVAIICCLSFLVSCFTIHWGLFISASLGMIIGILGVVSVIFYHHRIS